MIAGLFGGAPRWIVAGLGNPGRDYENTRHNMGYLAIEKMAGDRGLSIVRNRFRSLTAVERRSGGSVLYMKPLTYMNLSGEAIAEAARFFKIPPERVIVLCDDVSLPAGTLRIREKGSAGGHNGLKSIIKCLGSEEFPRIRIGVGAADREQMIDHVLSAPSAADMKLIRERFDDVAEAVELIMRGELTLAQSRYNGSAKK